MSRVERCSVCDRPTDRAGRHDDSMFCDQCDAGPFCETCCLREEECLCPSCATKEIERLHKRIEELKAAWEAEVRANGELERRIEELEREKDAPMGVCKCPSIYITTESASARRLWRSTSRRSKEAAMADEERLVTALRAAGFFYRRGADGWVCAPAEEVLKETEGTLLRARVEAGLAWEDFTRDVRDEFRLCMTGFYLVLAKVLKWITRRGER